MFYKKQGFPENDEIVICTVKNILPHSVFVDIDEYGREGMVHISEVSPGRIRNLRDFVSEGRKIVCKVLNINKERGYIDLSLRRVNLIQRRKKSDDFKQEMKAEKLLEQVGKSMKLSLENMYKEVGYKILKNYPSLTECFKEIISSNLKLSKLGIKNNIAEKIESIVLERMKPQMVSIKGILKLLTRESNGIEAIKKILNNLSSKGVAVSYLGAPKYRLSVEDSDYKKAENKLRDAVNSSMELSKKLKAEFEFNRKDA